MADPDDIWTAALQEAYASAPTDEVILGGIYNDPPVCGEAKDYALATLAAMGLTQVEVDVGVYV